MRAPDPGFAENREPARRRALIASPGDTRHHPEAPPRLTPSLAAPRSALDWSAIATQRPSMRARRRMAALNSRLRHARRGQITHAPTPAYRSAQTGRRPARRQADERAHGLRRRNAGRGHPFALRRGHQRPHDAHARGGLADQRRNRRPPLPPAPARLPRAGLQLAQGDAPARGRRLPRRRPRPARLRTHHRLGRRLRRRPARLRHAESGPRCAGPRGRAGPRLRGRRHRPRLRVPGRRLLRADSPRYLPFGGDDERSVWRPARAAGW